jgi:hypothetical protein
MTDRETRADPRLRKRALLLFAVAGLPVANFT